LCCKRLTRVVLQTINEDPCHAEEKEQEAVVGDDETTDMDESCDNHPQDAPIKKQKSTEVHVVLYKQQL